MGDLLAAAQQGQLHWRYRCMVRGEWRAARLGCHSTYHLANQPPNELTLNTVPPHLNLHPSNEQAESALIMQMPLLDASTGAALATHWAGELPAARAVHAGLVG